ncbi:MAG TPA: acetyl-CoA carboxylase biotin carboxyl carrier protein subunit, partial [Polyangiaceae bacterium]|nr:acetyl-CoA carboxylase biotin carboxyl carrier protein subunit [Polyangiaceae bacterium]
GQFRLRDYERFLDDNAESIRSFKANQQAAFDAERQRWAESSAQRGDGAPQAVSGAAPAAALSSTLGAHSGLGSATAFSDALPPGAQPIESHVSGSVWKLCVAPGASVKSGDPLLIIESMKMEIAIEAPFDGTVVALLVGEGKAVTPGECLLGLRA